MMNHARRRRDTLILLVLCAESFPVTKLPGYAPLAHVGPYPITPHLQGMFKKAVPMENDRNKEMRSAMKVVNATFPAQFGNWSAESKLYVVAQTVKGLIGSGWSLKRYSEMEQAFVHRLYKVSESMNGVSPPDNVIAAAMEAPEKLRKLGAFGDT